MPCDSIISQQVSFSAGTDPDLMKAALEDAGYHVYAAAGSVGSQLRFGHKTNYRMGGTFSNGVFTVNEGTDTDAIKRAYSVASVKKTAARMGWKVTQDKKNPLKMVLSK